MSTTRRSALVTSLVTAGTAVTTNRTNDALNRAADAVGELFSDVDAGNRPVGDLDNLVDYLANPSRSGQQPPALGGPTPPSDQDEALNVIMNSTTVPVGVKMAIQRLITPSASDYIQVKDDGTPVEIETLQNEVTAKTNLVNAANTAKTAAETALQEMQDENHTGSLAQQLRDARAAAATPPDMLPKAEVQQHLAAIEHAEGQLRTGMLSTTIDNRTELQDAIADAQSYAS